MIHAKARLTPASRLLLWTVRLTSLAMAVIGITIGWQRLYGTQEQTALRRYVEDQLPILIERERAIRAELDRLGATPSPSPEEARALLVDRVIPRIIALRRLADGIGATADTVRPIHEHYLRFLDTWMEACRTSVRAIDDPALDPVEGARRVRERFAAANDAASRWTADLEAARARAGFDARR